MSNDMDRFVQEGLLRYRQATNTYCAFRTEVQNRLQAILKSQKNWGPFVPNVKSVKSTTYGLNYPLLNARIEGKCNGTALIVVIAVNWYQSEGDWPFYCLWIEGGSESPTSQEKFQWNSEFTFQEQQLRFSPNKDVFNLEADFRKLLDEGVRYWSSLAALQ